jgi:RNA polymerase sigma factor (sigma-70 family)
MPERPDAARKTPGQSNGLLSDFLQRIRPLLKAVAREHAQSVPDCKEDESDIVQRSMVKAVEHMDDFNGETSGQWRAWLISIVRNQAKDVRRYWSQERRAHKYEETDSHVVGGLIDQSPPPATSVDEKESREGLDRAIATLTIEEQQFVRWRLYHFTTYREMAQRLNIAEHTARRRCEAALAALRQAWANQDS